MTVSHVAGVDEATFQEYAQRPRPGCPVSRALAGVPGDHAQRDARGLSQRRPTGMPPTGKPRTARTSWRPRRGRPAEAELPRVAAQPGLVVEDAAGDFCGAVVLCEKDAVTLEDRHGKWRVFPLAGHVPAGRAAGPAGRPASGPGRAGRRRPGGRRRARSRRRSSRAKVARASRIYVEGRHDAELVEQIWGDDLRDVGVVVEYLGGIDDLPAIVPASPPAPASGWACWSTTWSPVQGEPDRGPGRVARTC